MPEQFWPVVEQDVRGPDLVWRESEVLDARVAFWIPGKVDICPILGQQEKEVKGDAKAAEKDEFIRPVWMKQHISPPIGNEEV